jgi:hypothetical protein
MQVKPSIVGISRSRRTIDKGVGEKSSGTSSSGVDGSEE